MSKRSHGEGSVYPDGDRWIAAISVRDLEGRRRRVRRSAGSQREARRRLRELREQYGTGAAVDGKRQTLAQFLDAWLDLARRKLRASTYHRHEGIVRNHIVPALGQSTQRTDDIFW